VSVPAFRFSANIRAVDTPPIPEAKGWITQYDGRHGPLIDLSQAVPGTPPPDALLDKLVEEAAGEAFRYGPILGDSELRAAYAADVSTTYGTSVPDSQVAITAGCNQAFVATMLALAAPGERVILPAPWYFNHKMSLDMLGVGVVPLHCRPEDGFVPDVEQAAGLIDPSVKAILLVTPNNPTGAIYPPATIAAFAKLAREKGIALVLDETYRDFLPAGSGRPHEELANPDWADHVIQLYSFSKAYAIPGYRLGAITAHAAFMAELAKVLDNIQICPPRIAQKAVAWAIEGIRPWREAQRDELRRRAEACRAAFAPLNAWRVDSVGAYFAFVAHPFPEKTAIETGRRLATELGILTLPGPYFGPGRETHLRFAFANVGVEVLSELPGRLKHFI